MGAPGFLVWPTTLWDSTGAFIETYGAKPLVWLRRVRSDGGRQRATSCLCQMIAAPKFHNERLGANASRVAELQAETYCQRCP